MKRYSNQRQISNHAGARAPSKLRRLPLNAASILVGLTLAFTTLAAQSAIQFVDSGQRLGNGANDVVLGDVDGDGDLDAVDTGIARAGQIWINQGGTQRGAAGSFLDSGQTLTRGSSVRMADLDGDRDLDVFFVGFWRDSNRVWLNQGGLQGGMAGTFLESGQVLSGNNGALALGDLDGDGDIDAFITDRSPFPSQVWINDGRGRFTDSGKNLGTKRGSSVALGDLDNDADLDAFVANEVNEGIAPLNLIWLNQGGRQGGALGDFLEGGQLVGVSPFTPNAVALGDLDHDGDVDAFVVKGSEGEVWLNQGGRQGLAEGTFVLSRQTLPAGAMDVALGDVDQDGDLDAFIACLGGRAATAPNRIYENDGTGQFRDTGLQLGSSAWAAALGDLDGDGDLDAFVAGASAPHEVWRNQTAPRSFGHFVYGKSLATSFTALRQNFAVDLDKDGDADAILLEAVGGRMEIWLNQSDLSRGELGTFTLAQNPGLSGGGSRLEIGDVDNDGDPDMLVIPTYLGATGGSKFQILLNHNGTFVDSAQSLALPRFGENYGALADVDMDGDLDAVVSEAGAQTLAVYWNNGFRQGGAVGVFSDSGHRFSDLSERFAELALGDVDLDGDPDAFFPRADDIRSVWINQGGSQGGNFGDFQACTSFRCWALEPTIDALGDLDGDGDLDVFSGRRVYLNEGGIQGGTTGEFVAGQYFGFRSRWRDQDLRERSVTLGDVDGDGDLDALVRFENIYETEQLRFGAIVHRVETWLNEGNGRFRISQTLGIGIRDSNDIPAPGNIAPTATLGDFDGDGRLDALVGERIWLNRRTGEGTSIQLPDGVRLTNKDRHILVFPGNGNARVPIRISRPPQNDFIVHIFVDSGCFSEDFNELAFSGGQTQQFITSGRSEHDYAEGELWNPFQGCESPAFAQDWEVLIVMRGPAEIAIDGPAIFYVIFRNSSLLRNCLLDEFALQGVSTSGAEKTSATYRQDSSIRPAVADVDNDAPLFRPLLRRFRDEILGGTPQGRYYTDLYHRWSPEAVQIVTRKPELMPKILDGLATWIPAIAALVQENGVAARITSDMKSKLNDVIQALKTEASPDFMGAIAREEAALDLGTFTDLTIDGMLTRLKARELPADFERIKIQRTEAPRQAEIVRSQSIPSFGYQLNRSTDLRRFNPQGVPIISAGGELRWQLDLSETNAAFYRISSSPPEVSLPTLK